MTTTAIQTATLTRVGDQFALVLDADLTARLGITGETVLTVQAQDGTLLVSPAPVAQPDRATVFAVSTRKMLQRYESTFRKRAK